MSPLPPFSFTSRHTPRRSLPLFLTQRDDLPRRSYENSNAFVRDDRPISFPPAAVSSRRRRCSPCPGLSQSLHLPPPSAARISSRTKFAGTCITDFSKSPPPIALLGDIVESRVTIFTRRPDTSTLVLSALFLIVLSRSFTTRGGT